MSILISVTDEDSGEIKEILHGGDYSDVVLCTDASKITQALKAQEHTMGRSTVGLILLDVSRDWEAIKYCKEIKEHESYGDVPVIILSENASQETFQMAFAYGASDFIHKPIRHFELLTRVRSSLKMKHETDRRKSREFELVEATRQLTDLNTVLNRLSLIDSLTSIPNRRCFDQALNQELRLCARNNSSLSLIIMDVDYFKLFNDSYGHKAGDDCLKQVAQKITSCLRRPSDLVARYGGEEFAAVLPDTDEEGARFIAEEVFEILEQAKIEHASSKTSDFVTVSQGIATYRSDMDLSALELIECADNALYSAKNSGRNCFVAYDFTRTKKRS